MALICLCKVLLTSLKLLLQILCFLFYLILGLKSLFNLALQVFFSFFLLFLSSLRQFLKLLAQVLFSLAQLAFCTAQVGYLLDQEQTLLLCFRIHFNHLPAQALLLTLGNFSALLGSRYELLKFSALRVPLKLKLIFHLLDLRLSRGHPFFGNLLLS